MEGYLSINETVHSRPNRAAILRGYPAWIRTKRCEEFFDNEDKFSPQYLSVVSESKEIHGQHGQHGVLPD